MSEIKPNKRKEKIMQKSEKIKFKNLGTVAIEIERRESARYWLSAKTKTGFDLCNMHNGYLKRTVQGNSRLRSKKSIEKEIDGIFKSMIQYIEDNQNSMIVDSKTIKTKIFCRSFKIPDASRPIVDLYQVRSKTSGVSASWYAHDLFKDFGEITIEIKRCEKGYLQFFADDSELYDLEKVKEFSEREDFKEQKLAFFRYEEIKRLLGEEHGNIKSLSGLFA